MTNRFTSILFDLPVILLWGKYLTNPTNTYPNLTLTLTIGILVAAWYTKTLLTLCYHRGAALDELSKANNEPHRGEGADKQVVAYHVASMLGLKPSNPEE